MNIRPCFYLRDWETGDKEALKNIANLGFPIWLHAEDVQRSPQAHEILELFPENQLHILSFDVDDKRDHLEVAVQTCAQKGMTHLITLQDFSPALLEKVPELPDILLKKPWAAHFLVSSHQKKLSPFMERAFDLDGPDYRNWVSGNSILPIFFVQNIALKRGSRENFRRIFFHLLRKKVEIEKIPLENFETPITEKSLEKTCFDWGLLALSSLRNSQKPKHSALSVAMGAFIACTPFYGLQTPLILACAFIFRLNFPLAFLGSQVSLPPIYSLLVPLQVFIGFYLTGTPFDFSGEWVDIAKNHFLAWWLGATIVGGVLAFALGLTWFVIQKRSQEREVTWSGKLRGGKFGNLFLMVVLKHLGLKAGYFILYIIIPYFYLFAPRARRGLNEYWRIINPNMGFLNRQWQIMKHELVFAKTLMDQAYQAHHEELVFDVQYTLGHVLKGKEQNDKSLLMLFSHFGGWGITTQGFSRRKYDRGPIHVLRYQTDQLSTEKVFPQPENSKVKPIYVNPGEPLFMSIHDVMGKGGTIALMGDRPFDSNFELVPLLGRLAPIPTTPFRLGQTYKAQVCIVVGIKGEGMKYSLVTDVFEAESLKADQMVEKYLSFFEKYIRENPHQWFNLFEYWSKLPTLPNGMECRPSRYKLIKTSS